MAEFIKVGERIKLRPNVEGLEFNLEGGKIYDLKYCDTTGETYLQEMVVSICLKRYTKFQKMMNLRIVY